MNQLPRRTTIDAGSIWLHHYWQGLLKVAEIQVGKQTGSAILLIETPLIESRQFADLASAEEELTRLLAGEASDPEDEEEREELLKGMEPYVREYVETEMNITSIREMVIQETLGNYRTGPLDQLRADFEHRREAHDAVLVCEEIRSWNLKDDEVMPEVLDIFAGSLGMSRERVIRAIKRVMKERDAAFAEDVG